MDKNKKIGVIALSTDVTAERDFARILPMDALRLRNAGGIRKSNYA